jgi:hypothetical protein
LLIGVRQGRLSGGELGLPLVDSGLERLLFNREEHLVLFDLVAILEQAGTEKSRHPRPQIDLFERLGPPYELELFGHRAQLCRLDQDRRRRPGLLRIRREADQDCELNGKQRKEATQHHYTPHRDATGQEINTPTGIAGDNLFAGVCHHWCCRKPHSNTVTVPLARS